MAPELITELSWTRIDNIFHELFKNNRTGTYLTFARNKQQYRSVLIVQINFTNIFTARKQSLETINHSPTISAYFISN